MLTEATGLRETLDLVDRYHIHKIIIEMNASTIAEAVQSKNFPITQWGQISIRCARFLEERNETSIAWVHKLGFTN
jgi:hypothetical protein